MLIAAAVAAADSTCLAAGPVSLRKKDVPPITLENLSPPYLDHDYFHNAVYVPFENGATAFSLVNAWWLSEASTLVYADEDFVRQIFTQAGLNRVRFFDRAGTQCFIASSQRFAVVAFRGSQIWKRGGRFEPGQIIADFKTNIDIRLSDWDGGGKVHRGFQAALDAVWDDMLPEISKLRDRSVPIWVTGHSLGAALATLAADRLQAVQGLYTFGSPRVGDEEFKERFSLSGFRVVNGRDIVAEVPPRHPYRHVGELVFIDREGGVHTGRGFTEKSGGPGCPAVSNASPGGEEARKSDSAPYIPAAIRDHVPLLYSIHLWNELVESRVFRRCGQAGLGSQCGVSFSRWKRARAAASWSPAASADFSACSSQLPALR